MGDFVWDEKNSRKNILQESEVRERSVRLSTSKKMLDLDFFSAVARRYASNVILGCFGGWAKGDSWVILKKSQKVALVELKQDEKAFCRPALSSLRWRFC